MIDRFKKVFIICSLDHYDFLEEHKEEILKNYEKQKIEMPYLFGKIDEEYEDLVKAADIVLHERGNNNPDKRKELAEDTLLDDKLEDAKKRMKRASTFIFIEPDYHPTKLCEELSIAAMVETTTELLEARHRKIHIESINPSEFVRSKQKTL